MTKRVSSREDQDAIVLELSYIRTILKDISEALVLRVEGEISTVLSYLAAMNPKDRKKIVSIWQKELRGSTFKPAKGRLKDLKKIDRLMESLLDLIIDYDSKSFKNSPHNSANAIAPQTTPP